MPATMMTNSTAPPPLVTPDTLRQFVLSSGNDTGSLIVSLYQTMRVDVAEQHARELAADRAWQKRRSKDRGAAIRAVAQDCGKIIKVSDRAEEVRRRLSVYASGTYRFERDRPPANPARARLNLVLVLYSGNVPSRVTIWRAIVGIS
jgi:hypothetical protein